MLHFLSSARCMEERAVFEPWLLVLISLRWQWIWGALQGLRRFAVAVDFRKFCVTDQPLCPHLSKAGLPFWSRNFLASPPYVLSLLGKRFWVLYHWMCFVLPFGFWQSFSFALVKCFHFTLECNLPQTSSCLWGFIDKRACGEELPFMLGFLMADFTDFCFPCVVGSAWACVPSCCWSCTFEKKAYGTLSHADFLSVLISSILIYPIFTLESFGMQTHVRTSSWESTELHLHLLALVHGHTTVCIILALDKANLCMDIKLWHSFYMLLSGPVSVPLTWGDTFLWKSSLYTDLSVSIKMFLEHFSEETIIPANWPHIGNTENVWISRTLRWC